MNLKKKNYYLNYRLIKYLNDYRYWITMININRFLKYYSKICNFLCFF